MDGVGKEGRKEKRGKGNMLIVVPPRHIYTLGYMERRLFRDGGRLSKFVILRLDTTIARYENYIQWFDARNSVPHTESCKSNSLLTVLKAACNGYVDLESIGRKF
jgi:hypothetical protein